MGHPGKAAEGNEGTYACGQADIEIAAQGQSDQCRAKFWCSEFRDIWIPIFGNGKERKGYTKVQEGKPTSLAVKANGFSPLTLCPNPPVSL